MFIYSGNNNQTYFKNLISPLFSSQNQDSKQNSSYLQNRYDYYNINDPQNMNHEFIKSKLLNNKLQNKTKDYDILIEMIIDDLLIENVFELQSIEEMQEKMKRKENLKDFIKDYYQNFEQIRKLEDNISDKLNSHDYGIRLDYDKPQLILDGKQDRRHVVYKNPFISDINESINLPERNPNLIRVKIEEKPNKNPISISPQNNNINQSSKRKSKKETNFNSKAKKKEDTINTNNKNQTSSKEKSEKNVKISPNSSKNHIIIENLQSGVNSNNSNSPHEKNCDKENNLQEEIKNNFLNNLSLNNLNFMNVLNDTKANSKIFYGVKFHKNLISKCEAYKKTFDEYMKETGVFFVPNVFMLYEDAVNKLTNEIFEECFYKSLKELDDVALNMIKLELVDNKID